jgi:hypothetical protein
MVSPQADTTSPAKKASGYESLIQARKHTPLAMLDAVRIDLLEQLPRSKPPQKLS